MRVRVHVEAPRKIRDARSWYHQRSPVSAIAFAPAVETAVLRITNAPDHHPLAGHGTRKFVLQRFPFNVFYLSLETETVIVALAHQKRRPGYWSSRVS